jgi:REP element-mobilizing transposase RayT
MQHAGWRSRGYIPHCDAGGVVQRIVISTTGAKAGIEANCGQRFLEAPEAARAVEDTLLHFDGDRYRLLAWCIMPNHVHAVAEQIEGWPLASIVHSWKSFSANTVNRALGRSGALWLREYFDRYMRDDHHLLSTMFYVEQNPVEAGLVDKAEDWTWSSAHRR